MIKAVSLWIKDPISTFDKKDYLNGCEYETKKDLFNAVMQCDGGFVVQNTTSERTMFINANVKIVEYELLCLSNYQLSHGYANQAPYKMVVTVAVVTDKFTLAE